MTVVSDSSPLIYLAALSDFPLLRALFGAVIIPPAVYREVVVGGAGYPVGAAVAGALNVWVRVLESTGSISGAVELHRGEAEAIALAREVSADAVLLDDRAAVTWARHLGLTVLPTPAIYIAAKRQGHIEGVRKKLDQLREAGFWLKDSDYEIVLREAGEL